MLEQHYFVDDVILRGSQRFSEKTNMHIKRMVWQQLDDRRKYHLVNWDTMCLPKDCGGLGVLDLGSMNKLMLCKWVWKLENIEGTQKISLTRKYFHN
jgi:hypothetical protein